MLSARNYSVRIGINVGENSMLNEENENFIKSMLAFVEDINISLVDVTVFLRDLIFVKMMILVAWNIILSI